MKQILICMLLLAALLLSGCGGSAPAAGPVTSISVEMSEFKYTPSTLVVVAGQEISLKLSNNGGVEHKFSILKKGIVAKPPFDAEKQAADILASYKLAANSSGEFKFTLPEPGEYQIICDLPGHMEAGMVGTMTAVSK